MQDKENAESSLVPSSILPWIIAASALLVYLATMSRWVTLPSLPFVGKVAGWDWTLPQSAPLLLVLTYPIRWLPQNVQPLAMNAFAAGCAALTLALLARSVMLLPHDRTHEQRQRERSEFSLLSIRAAWLPPLFAVLVCGLQTTFWEHATAATGESLSLLLFAYCIRCLLESRIDQRDSWLYQFAFVYGLGTANDWAFVGFFPLFLIAVIWIRGFSFFRFDLLAKMAGFGVLGLLLYLLLPLIWTISGTTDLAFWEMLKAYLGNQKSYLLDFPSLRSRALILSLTSILPVIIMGIRWPATFGDTSAAGSALTNIMFRVIHLLFLVACLSVAFDQKFSPRALGFGLPFLTFYYLGALCVGYFSGYVLLVFGETRSSKSWRRRSAGGQAAGKLVAGCVWLAAIAVPVALAYKNFSPVRAQNGTLLKDFAAAASAGLPDRAAIILSDDAAALMLADGYARGKSPGVSRIYLHTRSLAFPDYQRALLKRYSGAWPNLLTNEVAVERIDDGALLYTLRMLQRTNDLYYLHPSFGYYFESFYPQIKGLASRLAPYSPDQVFPPPQAAADLLAGEKALNDLAPTFEKLKAMRERGSLDAQFLSTFYSRAANFYGVVLQRNDRFADAGKWFELASGLHTNNMPAQVNLEFNQSFLSRSAPAAPKVMDEKLMGTYRNWEKLMSDNGPFDHPDITLMLGKTFLSRGLARQAAIEINRTQTLAPTNMAAQLSMVDLYLQTGSADKALEEIKKIRSSPAHTSMELDLVRLEASAYFAQTNLDMAIKLLRRAHESNPRDLGVLDTLAQAHMAATNHQEALAACEKMLAIAPGSPDVLLAKANILYTMQERDKAIAALDEILKRNPAHISALLYKGFLYTQAKEYDKAAPVIEEALDADPKNVEALIYYSVIEMERKNYGKAIEKLDLALKYDPNNWNALRNRALTHLRNGSLSEAKADYETLLRKEPFYHVPYFGLADIAYQRKDPETAIRYYELYLRYAPKTDAPEVAEERNKVMARLNELKGGQR